MQVLQPLHFSAKVFRYFMVAFARPPIFFPRCRVISIFFQGWGILSRACTAPSTTLADDLSDERVQGDDLAVDLEFDLIFHGIPP